MQEKPLVSICIPKYNYASYLGQCIDSVLAQTYSNFEVIIRDNASEDNSYEIALSYRAKFLGRGIAFRVDRNPYNYGSDRNSELCAEESKGEFRLILASDDILYPQYLEEVMRVFIQYDNVSMVMTHRDHIDAMGRKEAVLPFYNCSCIVPGESQAAVFMMSGIAIPGQQVMRVSEIEKIRNWICTFQVANDWYYNALMSCVGDIAYIDRPLMQYRVHDDNETSQSEDDLTAIFEHYQIINRIAKVSKEFGYEKPMERLPQAVEKLGSMCLRYAYRMIKTSKYAVAQQYLSLAKVFRADIETEKLYQVLKEMLTLDKGEQVKKIAELEGSVELQRNVSYEPPEGFIRIE